MASRWKLPLAFYADKMRGWAIGNGKRKVDWDATFSNLLRDEAARIGTYTERTPEETARQRARNEAAIARQMQRANEELPL